MSRYVDIFCVDCGVHCGIDNINREFETLQRVIKCAQAIAILNDAVVEHHADLSLEVAYSHIDMAFFAKHASHRLRVVDEYGHLYVVVDGRAHELHGMILPNDAWSGTSNKSVAICLKSKNHDGPCHVVQTNKETSNDGTR